MKINFGETLQKALDRRNLSQVKAANMLHISPQAISSYIRNKRFPDIETFRYILETFQLDANNVLHIKLVQPRECLTEIEQRMLHVFREIDFTKQELFISILKIIVQHLHNM